MTDQKPPLITHGNTHPHRFFGLGYYNYIVGRLTIISNEVAFV